jgi:hypothetical protein
MTLHAPITIRSSDNQLFVAGYTKEKPDTESSGYTNNNGDFVSANHLLDEWLASKIEIPVSEGSKEELRQYVYDKILANASCALEVGVDISELSGRIKIDSENYDPPGYYGDRFHYRKAITLLPEKEEGQDELWEDAILIMHEGGIDRLKQQFTIIKNK